MGWVFDRCNGDDPQDSIDILNAVIALIGDIDPIAVDFDIPSQMIAWLLSMGNRIFLNEEPAIAHRDLDFATDVPLLPGYDDDGTSGGNVMYRLREGIERYLITDIFNPAASARAQSEIYVMWDILSTEASSFNHIPGGSNVLYMDGHCEFQRYEPNGDAPVNGGTAITLGVLATLSL